MRPNTAAGPDYIAAFQEIVKRITESLSDQPEKALPVKMVVAGGAAMPGYPPRTRTCACNMTRSARRNATKSMRTRPAAPMRHGTA